jgi:hypothetical protein
MGVKTKEIKIIYPMVDHTKTEKSKIYSKKKSEYIRTGKNKRFYRKYCVEDMEQKSLPPLQKAILLIVAFFAGIIDRVNSSK